MKKNKWSFCILGFIFLAHWAPPDGCAQTPRAAADRTAKSQIPSSSHYWKYHRWYLNHSVVDVIISGEDPQHLARVLAGIHELQQQGVLIRRVIVIGGESFAQLDSKARSRADEAALYNQLSKELGPAHRDVSAKQIRALMKSTGISPDLTKAAQAADLGTGSPVSGIDRFLASLQVVNSPTWIVTYKGKKYIYEGVETISRMFSKGGVFVDGEG